MKKDQKGFSAVEMLLIIVVIGIIGFVGWFVWHARSNTNKTLQNTSQGQADAVKTTKKAPAPAPKDPTADWVAYSSTAGQYSLKHPKTWVEGKYLDLCNPGLFLVGGNADSAGVCGSENFGEMNVDSETGDTSADRALTTGYTYLTKTNVTVSNVSGTRYSGTASGQQNGEVLGGYADGTKVVKYVFVTAGRTYTATYDQNQPYPDVLSDFDLMVTKTLKFSS